MELIPQNKKVGEFSHVILTNLTYPMNDPMLYKRLDWYIKNILPGLKAQTVKNVDIAIKVRPEDRAKVEKVLAKAGFSDVIVCVEYNLNRLTKKGEAEYHNSHGQHVRKYTTFGNMGGLKKYELQTSADSDDFISPTYIEKVQQAVIDFGYKLSLHIHFQPLSLDCSTGEIKKMKHRYGQGIGQEGGSAFFTLYNPDPKTKYVFCREKSHYWIPKLFSNSILLPEGDCWIGVNGMNHRTKGMPESID